MKYAKAIAAAIGGLSPAAVVGFLAMFHIDVSASLVTSILLVAVPVLAALGVAVAPANRTPVPFVMDVPAAPEAPAEAPVADAPVVEDEVLDPSVLDAVK